MTTETVYGTVRSLRLPRAKGAAWLVGDGSPVFEDYLTQRESPAIPAKDECSDVSEPRTDTAGCTYVKRSGSRDGVPDGIQPDITEESRKNHSRQYEQGGRESRTLR